MQTLARAEHIPALKAIWAASFPEDAPEDIDDFFARQFRASECLVHLEDGAPVSMAFMLPAVLRTGGRTLPIQYIYAASTLPPWRGRGIFASLLRRAHELAAQRGQAGSFLHPQEPSLYGYYRRFGYTPWFTARQQRFSRDELLAAEGRAALLREEGEDAYFALRGRFLAGYPAWVEWEDRFTRQAVRDAQGRGGGLLAGEEGCLLYETAGDTALVSELLCLPEKRAACLKAAAQRLGCAVLDVREPAGPSGAGEPFGMWLPLSPQAQGLAGPAYMGLTLG